MIRDHVWRPPHGAKFRAPAPQLDRPCEFMNCGRPRSEHARAVSGRFSPVKAGAL